MKLITIQVSDEEHTSIKLAATKAGLSIKDYLLGDRRVEDGSPKAVRIGIDPGTPNKVEPWAGPLFRDKKKSKL